MIVNFTELELNTDDLICNKKVSYPFDPSWTRYSFPLNAYDEKGLENWLLQNVDGRFGYVFGSENIVIYFEKEVDAVVFKMKDGETAWINVVEIT